MANKAPAPPVVESATAPPTADRHPALPDQTTTPTPSPTVVSYDPLPHEKHLFESLFKTALGGAAGDSSEDGPVHAELKRLSLDAAKKFLLRSGISEANIDVILSTVAPSPRDSTKKRTTMSRARFYAAVRLVQLRQQSIRVTNLDLNKLATPKDKPLEPPYFEGVAEESRPSRLRASAEREQEPRMRHSKSYAELDLEKQRRRSSTDAVAPTGLARSTSGQSQGQRDTLSSSLASVGDRPRELRSCLRNSSVSNKNSSKSLGTDTLTTTSGSTSASSLVNNDDETVRRLNSNAAGKPLPKPSAPHNEHECCACCKSSKARAAALEAELSSARKLIKSLYDEMDTMRKNAERAIAKTTLQGHHHQRHSSQHHEHNHRQRSAPPTNNTRGPRASIAEPRRTWDGMRSSVHVRSNARRTSTNEANQSRSRSSGHTRDYYGNYSEYSHSRSLNSDVHLTVPMTYRNEEFNSSQDFEESLDIATDLQQLHSASALSKSQEDQQRKNKRPGMLSRMKQSIRHKKGEQMDGFNPDTSGYTEPDSSWQRLTEPASSASIMGHSNYNLSSSLRHKRPPVA